MSTGERVCWYLTLVGAGMTVAPFVADEALTPMGSGRFAMAFFGLIVGLSCFICAFFFRSRNRVKRHLLAGRDMLARWTYSETEWRAFAGEETSRQASSKRGLLGFTAGFMVLVTLGSIVRDRKSGVFIGAVLFVTWILCWLVARASVRSQGRHEKGPTPEVRIGRDGLLIGEELHDWRGWGASLEACEWHDGPPPVLEFSYAMISGNATVRRTETVRVPVPIGKEAEAHAIVRQLQA